MVSKTATPAVMAKIKGHDCDELGRLDDKKYLTTTMITTKRTNS